MDKNVISHEKALLGLVFMYIIGVISGYAFDYNSNSLYDCEENIDRSLYSENMSGYANESDTCSDLSNASNTCEVEFIQCQRNLIFCATMLNETIEELKRRI